MDKITEYPTLEEVLLVEDLIIKYSQEFNSKKLWEKTNKKITFKKFEVILDYLEEKGKIMIDKKDGIIFWTWNPRRIRELINKGLKLR